MAAANAAVDLEGMVATGNEDGGGRYAMGYGGRDDHGHGGEDEDAEISTNQGIGGLARLDGNAALDLATSNEEWQMLVQRFGGNDDESNEAPGEISFANVVDLFGDIKPVEGYLEEILRRYMKTLVSVTTRLSTFDEQVKNIRGQLMGARRATLDRIVRNWKNQKKAHFYEACNNDYRV